MNAKPIATDPMPRLEMIVAGLTLGNTMTAAISTAAIMMTPKTIAPITLPRSVCPRLSNIRRMKCVTSLPTIQAAISRTSAAAILGSALIRPFHQRWPIAVVVLTGSSTGGGFTWATTVFCIGWRNAAGTSAVPAAVGRQLTTTVTARRFCAQLASSDPVAIGRSLP